MKRLILFLLFTLLFTTCDKTTVRYSDVPPVQISNWTKTDHNIIEIWVKNTEFHEVDDIVVVARLTKKGDVIDAGLAYMLKGETLYRDSYAYKKIVFPNITDSTQYDDVIFNLFYDELF